MATHFHIRELTGGLCVEVREDFKRWQRLLVAGFVGTCVGAVSARLLGGWWWIFLSIVAAWAAFAVARGRRAELQVTNVEFYSSGDIGRRVHKRIVCTGDVRCLEFREESAFVPRYGGLYAATAHGTTLLLPMLDFNATAEVIRAIENKFPGLAEGWRSGQLQKEKSGVESAS
jgi:hypothetical protein